jgi:hypothetical protein
MKDIKSKEFLLSTIFCLSLAIIPKILGLIIPFDYFSSPIIEKHYLYLANGDLRDFTFAVPPFLILLGVLIYYFKDKPLIASQAVVPLFMVSRDIFNGTILVFNTKNLYQPHISSFSWGTWFEYSSYLHNLHNTYILISVVFMFGSFFFIGVRLKKLGLGMFEN